MMCSLAYFITFFRFYSLPFNGVVISTVSLCTTQILIVLMYVPYF